MTLTDCRNFQMNFKCQYLNFTLISRFNTQNEVNKCRCTHPHSSTRVSSTSQPKFVSTRNVLSLPLCSLININSWYLKFYSFFSTPLSTPYLSNLHDQPSFLSTSSLRSPSLEPFCPLSPVLHFTNPISNPFLTLRPLLIQIPSERVRGV